MSTVTCFLCGQVCSSIVAPCADCVASSKTDDIGEILGAVEGMQMAVKILEKQIDAAKGLIKPRLTKGATEYIGGFKVERRTFMSGRFDTKTFQAAQPEVYSKYYKPFEVDSIYISLFDGPADRQRATA
jgi:predicted phage-related endonuclease